MPHDPIEYPLVVSAGASLVGQTDEASCCNQLVKNNGTHMAPFANAAPATWAMSIGFL